MMNKKPPIILYEGQYTPKDLSAIKGHYSIWDVRDIYKLQLEELFEVANPKLKFSESFSTQRKQFMHERMRNPNIRGNWIYFPWNGSLVHTVGEEDYYRLRTNRNKNLINADEQKKLRNCVVGIVGLSVGNTIAVGLSYQGISQTMKLAERDILQTSNLNRIRAGIDMIGFSKLAVTCQQIYEVDPYADLRLFPSGLTKTALASFFEKKPIPDVVFDEIDDFEMKIRLRLMARSNRVPVIMMTNLEENVLIDIERYDRDKSPPLFHGLAGGAAGNILKKRRISEAEKQKFAVQIVGARNVPQRALESLKEIGKTLVGRPQLGSTVAVSGGLAVHLVKRLILQEPLPSGRNLVKFRELLNLPNTS